MELTVCEVSLEEEEVVRVVEGAVAVDVEDEDLSLATR
jgi:hypothetical protein